MGDVGWDLRLESDGTRLDPVPASAKLLHPFDLELVVAPRVRFSGDVHVGGERFTLDSDIGTLTHYWGRRLPDSWVWVSAHGLGDGDGVLEAAVLRTRLWGSRRLSVVGGYVLMQGEGSTRQVIAPAYGLIGGHGDASRFEVAPGAGVRYRGHRRSPGGGVQRPRRGHPPNPARRRGGQRLGWLHRFSRS